MRMKLNLSLPPERTSVSRARQILDTALDLWDATDESRAALGVLITEACANAVVHGRHDGEIEVSISIEDQECVVEVANPDGTLKAGELVVDPPDPRAEGGRGLLLIKSLADKAQVENPRPGWVVLRMVKRLAPTGPPPERVDPDPVAVSGQHRPGG